MRVSSIPPNSPTCWETLTASCANAQEAIIVAPYIKEQPLNFVLESIAPNARITCVSRWTPQDIQAGTTDLACRSLTLERGGNFLLHNRLHAKYYRFDSNTLIGSANLTASGMNIHNAGNLEILCPPPEGFDWELFEHLLFLNSREVTDAEFDAWSSIVPTNSTRPQLPVPHTEDTVISWRPVTRNPEYLWLAYRQEQQEIPIPEQRAIATEEVATLAIPSELDRPQFNAWINISLKSSPFIDSVLAIQDQTDEEAYNNIASEWNISKAEAERSRTTAVIWINAFNLNG